MKLEHIKTFHGPNIYTHKPAILIKLNLGVLANRESREFEGFNDTLIGLLPGLSEHHCGLGHAGGFVERLNEGTFFGHIVEHIALEMASLVGIESNHGKTREIKGEPGSYNIIVEYASEHGMRFLLEQAVELVHAILQNESFPLEEILNQARSIVSRYELGPSTRSIINAAERRDIPWKRIGDGSLVQLGYGKHRKFIQAALTSTTSAIAVDIASDKDLTKMLLRQAGVPVPYGMIVRNVEEALVAFEEIGPPVTVKPLDGCQGRGVSLNLKTRDEIVRAFNAAREFSNTIIIEEQFEGFNFRVLIINGRMVAASHRLPPQIEGDAKLSIKELIDKLNADPLRGTDHEKPLTQINVDEILIDSLNKQGLTLETVPQLDQRVILREGCNLSTGGTATDVTDIVHPEIKKLCERAAQAIGLDICGVDLVLKDISKPLPSPDAKEGVIELNAAPGLRMHLHPSVGQARDVAAEIVDMLYPPGISARIPIVAITGTNGKTTVTRMIAHIFQLSGLTVGMTTTSGIFIGSECVMHGDTTGPRSAITVLSDPSVEVAVLETARGGVVKGGLGYDWSDVGVITNIQADHLGQDGIETVEDILYVKSLIAERVRAGGTLVLNADDEHLALLPENLRVKEIKKRIVYFSLRENHLLIKRHISQGGTAYFIRDGFLVESVGVREKFLDHISNIPATMGGTADFNIANSLAAVAACRALGLEAKQIIAALRLFECAEKNPGRINLFTVNGGYVLLDYGHNPEAFKSISRLTSAWKGYRVTAIIGVPGDRNNSLIEKAGRVAAQGFDRIVIREDDDLRGRDAGEVAQILYAGVKDEALERECKIVLDAREALKQQIEEISEGEVVVCFYETLNPLLELLKEQGAMPATYVEPLQIPLTLAQA